MIDNIGQLETVKEKTESRWVIDLLIYGLMAEFRDAHLRNKWWNLCLWRYPCGGPWWPNAPTFWNVERLASENRNLWASDQQCHPPNASCLSEKKADKSPLTRWRPHLPPKRTKQIIPGSKTAKGNLDKLWCIASIHLLRPLQVWRSCDFSLTAFGDAQ